MTLDLDAMVEAVHKALAPRVPNEHHHRCDSHFGKPCDCYGGKTNPAFEALDALVEEVRRLSGDLEAARRGADSFWEKECNSLRFENERQREWIDFFDRKNEWPEARTEHITRLSHTPGEEYV